jgi:hypothetical protein
MVRLPSNLLGNLLYLGEVKHKGKAYAGEQPAIVDRKVWKQAKTLLERQERGGKVRERNRQRALLQDLWVRANCGKRMVAGYTTNRGQRYPYYVCQKRGIRACPWEASFGTADRGSGDAGGARCSRQS